MKRRIVIALIAAALITQPVRAEVLEEHEVYALCEKASQEVSGGQLSPEMMEALCWHESRYTSDASNGSCYGIAQINPRWHWDRMEKWGVTEEALKTDAYSNILISSQIIWDLFQEANGTDAAGDPYWVLHMYNMNHKSAQRLWETKNYSKYATGIMDMAYDLEGQHGKHNYEGSTK